MDEEVKISEMQEAENVNDNDLIMIVQNSVNKKVKLSKLKGNETTVENNLESTSTTNALSANMRKRVE